MRLDPAIVRNQISNLLAVYPDLASDEEDLSLALASETGLDEFLTKLVRMIDDSKALISGTDARMAELEYRQERFKRRIEAYRSLIFKLMETANIKKRELPDATLSVRNGTPRVVITDENAIPEPLCRVIRKPDLVKVKEFLASGSICPGAEMSNAEPSLSIRVK